MNRFERRKLDKKNTPKAANRSRKLELEKRYRDDKREVVRNFKRGTYAS